MKSFLTIFVLPVAILASGCGGGKSGDAAKAMSALMDPSGQSGLMLREGLRARIREMHAMADGQATLARLHAEAMAADPDYRPELASNGWDAASWDSTTGQTCFGGDCSLSSSGDTSTGTVTISCTFDNCTEVCGATTYTFADGTATVGMNFSTSGTTITYAITMDMAGTVSGGEFGTTGLALDCNFSASMSVDTTSATLQGDATIGSCDGFSCTLGGEVLDCATMTDALSETSCSS